MGLGLELECAAVAQHAREDSSYASDQVVLVRVRVKAGASAALRLGGLGRGWG